MRVALKSPSHNAIMRVYEPFHKISTGRSTLSLSLSRVMVNEPVLKSFFFSTATRSMYPWFFIYVCETIRKGRCALPWNWTDPWLIYITILGKDYGGEARNGSMLSTALLQRFLWVDKSRNRWHFCQPETTIYTHIARNGMKIIIKYDSRQINRQ